MSQINSQSAEVVVDPLDDLLLRADWPYHTIVTLDRVEHECALRESQLSRPHALMVCLHGIKGITPEAWRLISSNYFTERTLACAIVFDCNAGFYEYSEIIVQNHFLNGDAVEYPTGFFTCEEKAENWLRDQLEIYFAPRRKIFSFKH